MRPYYLVAAPVVLAAFFLSIDRGATRASDPPPAEVHAALAIGHLGSARATGADAAPAPDAEIAPSIGSEERIRANRFEERARILLDSLASWAAAGAPVFPDLDVDEVAELLSRHPELADLFLAALVDASSRLQAYLTHAFYRVSDPGTRARLAAVARATWPLKKEVEEILADPTLVRETIRLEGNVELRSSLVNRLATSSLDDPEVVASLRRIIDDDPDAEIRTRAIKKLGKLDRPEVRDLLLQILRDPSREFTDRRAAAYRLRDRPDGEIRAEFAGLIGNPDTDTVLVRLAALGLGNAGPDDRSVTVLVDYAQRSEADPPARKNALSALASIARSADADGRPEILNRIQSTLDEIGRQEGETAKELMQYSELVFCGILDAESASGGIQMSVADEGSIATKPLP